VSASQPQPLALPRRSAHSGIAAFAVAHRDALTLAAAAALYAALLARSLPLAMTEDSWYALLGGDVVAHHGLPQIDTLALLTTGREWVDAQWLGQLALHGLASLGGVPLVRLANALLLLAAFTIALVAGARRGSALAAAVVALPVALVAGPAVAVRPQAAGELLFVVVCCLLAGERLGRRSLLVLPLLVLWTNLHGSVLLGAALTAGAGLLAIRRGQRLAGLALVLGAAAATLASPYAGGLPGYYRSLVGNQALAAHVAEWKAPTPTGFPFTFLLLALAAVLALRGWRRLTGWERLLLAVTAAGALVAVRGAPWLAYASLLVLPRLVAHETRAWRSARAPENARLQAFAASLSLLLVVPVAAAWLATGLRAPARGFPAGALAALQRAAGQTRTPVFATDRLADWALLQVPSLRGRVVFDVRYELLSQHEIDALAAAEAGVRWRPALLGARLVLAAPNEPLVGVLRGEPGTRVLYHDRDAVLLRLR
jgi:hypothetical protein